MIPETDLDDLIRKSDEGTLTAKEASRVAAALESGDLDGWEPTKLRILGRAGCTIYEPLIRTFLTPEGHPGVHSWANFDQTAAAALEVLCIDFGLTDKYMPKLVSFLEGVSWDRFDEVRLMAISLAGRYIRMCGADAATPEVKRLMSLLLATFMDAEERPLVRENAYIALALASGREWKDVRSPFPSFDPVNDAAPEEDIEQELLDWARSKSS